MMHANQAVNGNGRKVLVTGGAGFIGATLVRELLRHNYAVTVLDNFTTGTQEALSDLPVTLIEGDILDRGLLADVFAGFNAAVPLAADAGVANSLQDPIMKLLQRSCLNQAMPVVQCCRTCSLPAS